MALGSVFRIACPLVLALLCGGMRLDKAAKRMADKVGQDCGVGIAAKNGKGYCVASATDNTLVSPDCCKCEEELTAALEATDKRLRLYMEGCELQKSDLTEDHKGITDNTRICADKCQAIEELRKPLDDLITSACKGGLASLPNYAQYMSLSQVATTLHAGWVDCTACKQVTHGSAPWSGWLNGWDGGMHHECPHGQALTSLYSVHDNRKEDRRWKVACTAMNGATLSSCAWTGWTAWDGAWTLGSPDRIITGMASHHDNRKEDRQYNVKTCGVSGVTMHGATDDPWWQNHMDGEMNYGLPSERFLTRIISQHHNGAEDRVFRFSSVQMSTGNCDCTPMTHGLNQWSGWLNEWDQALHYECPPGNALTSLYSVHDNHREDRLWKLACSEMGGGALSGCSWTAYTAWDAAWTLGSADRVITGMASHHDNGREDRQYSIKTCAVTGVTMHGEIDDGAWQNSHDNALNYNLPNDRFLTRITSQHHNGAEDRVFRFSSVQMSTGKCDFR